MNKGIVGKIEETKCYLSQLSKTTTQGHLSRLSIGTKAMPIKGQ